MADDSHDDIEIRTRREGDTVCVSPVGRFDLARAATVAGAIAKTESTLEGCRALELDLASVHGIDGAGAVLIARLLDRQEAAGRTIHVDGERHAGAARLIALYRERRSGEPLRVLPLGRLARIGSVAGALPGTIAHGLDFTGRSAVAVPRAVMKPGTVNWRSLLPLIQQIGADGLLVSSAANLLVGVIIGVLGVSQLGRFGATIYVPELVVVAQFRELGPLITAVVVAGRSGAGLASEIATMKVSEEIDALRSMGFDPMRWLVVPRCLALVISVPLLTWVGNVLALAGGLVATTGTTDMTLRTYLNATADAITGGHFLTGMSKTPFLGLAIGMIACGQGLATQGGAAAVGTRTTSAVVLSIFGVIVISAIFTLVYAVLGV